MKKNIFLKKITFVMVAVMTIATFFSTQTTNAQTNNPTPPNNNKPNRPNRTQAIDKQTDRILNHALSTPEQIAQKRVEQLNKKIQLTEQQQKQVYDIALLKAKKIEQISNQKYNNPNREALKKELQETLKTTREKMKTVLTPEQQQQLRETRHINKPRPHRHHTPPHNKHAPRPQMPPQTPPPAQR